VEYGRARGVKIMIEFDMPGHAASWCTGYPEICPSTSCLQPLDPSSNVTFPLITSLLSECTGANIDQAFMKDGEKGSVMVGSKQYRSTVNKNALKQPSSRAEKKSWKSLFAKKATKEADSKAMFPYSLLHLGGDEVSYTCWEQSPTIQQWEQDNNIDGSEGELILHI
jgi:hexosaminidase